MDARPDWQQYAGTRDKLRERLSGVEKNIAEPDAEIKIAGELKPVEKEWRVWQGKDSRAASAWTSDEVMQKAIGEVINKNLEKIRRDLIAKGEVELTETLGYKTGQGWIGSAQKVQQGSQTVYQRTGYVWNTNLRGVTIIIRPRKNYVTGADNFESWYVHTAYPQLAR